MTQRDLVLGAVGGLQWDDVQVWALSLMTSGYRGARAMIVYDDDPVMARNLTNVGFRVVRLPMQTTVYNQRFYDFHHLLARAGSDFRYAVVCDARDIYFQADPMEWLEANLTRPLYAVSEGIRFRDEEWNRVESDGFNAALSGERATTVLRDRRDVDAAPTAARRRVQRKAVLGRDGAFAHRNGVRFA